MKKLSVISLVTVVVLALASVVVASERDQDRARELAQAGVIVPLKQIVSSAHEPYTGRVLETEVEKDASGYYYELEIVDGDGVPTIALFYAQSRQGLVQEPIS